MIITAGAANAAQAAAYIDAGAGEIFCGYVPDSWTDRYGITMPLNRREVRYCPVQIGGLNELRLLARTVRDRGAACALTFNAPCYLPEQLPEIAGIIEQCVDEGFTRFIAADPALIAYLHEQGLTDRIQLHISGEAGEINRYTLKLWRSMGASRIIFHRKTGLANMASMILQDGGQLEYEAFAMNEMCHFNGAFCSSLHCDELAHICHLPWSIAPVSGSNMPGIPIKKQSPQDVPGFSGCGLCALWDLRDIGITHLKVVGRGAACEDMVRDITALKTALDLMENASGKEQWRDEMLRRCFPDGCGMQCYYR